MSVVEPEHLAWFRKAEHNLLSISNNMVAASVPWDNVTSDAQQAAEKYLKGFLVYRARRPPKIHDLAELLAICMDFDQALSSLNADCRELTHLGFVSRRLRGRSRAIPLLRNAWRSAAVRGFCFADFEAALVRHGIRLRHPRSPASR